MAVCPYTVYTSSSDGAAVNMLICASSLNPVCAFAGTSKGTGKAEAGSFSYDICFYRTKVGVLL